MAYTTIPTAYTDGPGWNTVLVDKIRANFAAGVPDIFTTKGDLAVGTAADTAARLAVSATDGHILYADSNQSTGLRWGFPGFVKVNDNGTQAISNPATKLTELDNEYYDLYAAWASDRFTCNYAGYYLVTCMFQFDMSTLGNFAVGDGGNFMLYKSGQLYSTITMAICRAVGDYKVSTFGADIISLVAGDYVEFYAGRIGQSINVNPSADDTSHHISITYLPS